MPVDGDSSRAATAGPPCRLPTLGDAGRRYGRREPPRRGRSPGTVRARPHRAADGAAGALGLLQRCGRPDERAAAQRARRVRRQDGVRQVPVH